MFAAAAAASSVVIGSAPAQAGLDGSTVTANSWFGGTNSPPGVCDPQTNATCNLMDYTGPGGPTNAPLPIVPVTFDEDFLTLTTTSISDTTITIVNNSALPFCTTKLPCADVFDGFAFTFSGAPPISSVTVDPGSSANFLPVSLASNATAIFVNLAGDSPAVNSTLILDVTTGNPTFTRTVSGNWTDTTGWTPNGVPNGATVTAQLVNPASGTNNVNLGGGTFTVNQLQFSGANAGTWSVTNGTIVFGGTNPTFLNQGGSSGLASSLPNLTLNATTTFEIDNARAVTHVTGDITGAGGLIKTGAGTLTLFGTNTYSGATTIGAGTLQIDGAGVLGGGSYGGAIFDNGTLQYSSSANQTLSGVISGAGALIKDTFSSTLTLTGANTYTGVTNIGGGGTLQIGGAGVLGGGSYGGAINDYGTLQYSSFAAQTLSGVISGAGALIKDTSSSTLTLTGANTYSGPTAVDAGTLQIGGAGVLGGGSYGGGIFDNGTLQYSSSAAQTLSGVISGAGALIKDTSSSTLTLTGANTYSGPTAVDAGTLQIGGAGVLGGGSYGGGICDIGTLQYSSSANQTLSGVISGPGALTKDTSSSTLTLTGANIYSGGTTIGAGTLQIGNALALGTGTVTFAGNSTLEGNFTGTLSNNLDIISGVSATFGATGGNTLTLASANTMDFNGGPGTTVHFGSATDTGTVVLAPAGLVSSPTAGAASVDGGTLKIGNAEGSLPIFDLQGGLTVGSGATPATLDINGFLQTAWNLTGTSAGTITNSGTAATLTILNTANSAFAGVIQDGTSGPGGMSLQVAGSGGATLTLTGANTYTGTTFISSGLTLQIAGAGGLGGGSYGGGIADNGTLQYSSSAAQTLSGVISGGGALTKDTSSSTLTLTGANTYSGATTVNAGTLMGGVANAFSAVSATTINSGGALDLGGFAQTINNVSLAGGALRDGSLTGAIGSTGGSIDNIAGNSTLTTTKGVTTLTGANVFASIDNKATTINNGVTTDDLTNSGTYTNNATQNANVASNTGVITNSSGAFWNGDVKVGANTTGTITNQGTWTGAGNNAGGLIDNQAVWTGAIVNASGTFTNEGSVSGGVTNGGTAANSGSIVGGLTNRAGTFTNYAVGTLDTANVTGGVLVDLGTISGAAAIGSGATIGGSGTIGSLNAQTGSTVAPGLVSPYSTLKVNGAATFASGSTFVANVNAAGQNDRLNVGGALTVNGAGVQIAAAPGNFSAATAYTLITAQGGLTGAFSTLSTSSNLAFLSPVLTYDANDVYMRFRAIADFASVAQTPNQLAVANTLQPLGFASPLYSAVVTQTPAGAQQAFNALSGEIHASAISAAIEDSRLPREAVLDRLASPYGALQTSGPGAFMATANVNAPGLAPVVQTWGQGFGSSGHIGGDGNAASLNRWLDGFVFGADATLDNQYRLGLATSYTHSDLSDPDRASSGRIDSTSIGLYGGTSQQALQLRGGGFYTFNHYNTNSDVVFPGFGEADGSGYDGDTLQAFGEAGWRLALQGYGGESWFEPFAGFLAMRVETDGFTESGGDAALNGFAGSYGFGASTIGVRSEIAPLDGLPLIARVMLGWRHVYGDVDPSARLAFASAPATPFTVFGAPIARDALAAELGVDWRVTQTVALGLYYSGQIGSGANDNAIKGAFTVAF